MCIWICTTFCYYNTGEHSDRISFRCWSILSATPLETRARSSLPFLGLGSYLGCCGCCSQRGPLWTASQIYSHCYFLRPTVLSLSCTRDIKELFWLHLWELGKWQGQICILERSVEATAWGQIQRRCHRLPIYSLLALHSVIGNYISQAPLPIGSQVGGAFGGHCQKPGGEGIGEKPGCFHSYCLRQHLL